MEPAQSANPDTGRLTDLPSAQGLWQSDPLGQGKEAVDSGGDWE